jgi:uncharacterized protein with PIN domain
MPLHVNLNALVTDAKPALRTGEFHKVSCPHCPIGATEIMVERIKGQAQVRQIDQQRTCDSCGKVFWLKPTFRIIGVKEK